MPLSEEYTTSEYRISNKNERLMLGTGIVLALFIGIGIGLVFHNPLGIGMLTGFVPKDTSCLQENEILIAEQKAYIERQEATMMLQSKSDSLTEKIDTTWHHFQKNSSKEDLIFLQEYYREKTLIEKDLFSLKETLYDAKNTLSEAQDNIKICVEKLHATATTTSLSKVAADALSVDTTTLQSSLLETPKTSPALPEVSGKALSTACKIPGAIKACPPVTTNGKTCRAYQECGEDLQLGSCKVNEAACQ